MKTESEMILENIARDAISTFLLKQGHLIRMIHPDEPDGQHVQIDVGPKSDSHFSGKIFEIRIKEIK